jgi:hypothetical protein
MIAIAAKAREVMIDIFRKKDPTAVDRYFAESFMQHDPNFPDHLAGMKSVPLTSLAHPLPT